MARRGDRVMKEDRMKAQQDYNDAQSAKIDSLLMSPIKHVDHPDCQCKACLFVPDEHTVIDESADVYIGRLSLCQCDECRYRRGEAVE